MVLLCVTWLITLAITHFFVAEAWRLQRASSVPIANIALLSGGRV